MNDGTGKGIFQEWARRYAPGLIETQTAFPLDSDLGIPPKLAPIEGVFTGEKRNLSLGGPPPERMGYRGPGITPQTSSPATQETTSVPVAPTQENPLADYTPQPPVETATAEGEKKPGGISPVGMGILGMGLSMMATPPRQVPYSNAEIVGRSGLAGLGIYEKALEDKRRQQALDAETENRILTRQDQKLWREGLLADKETQRAIAKQNAESLEKLRIASGEAKTGRLVPVKQSDGSIAYERMLDAVGQEVPQKPERLVPVEQADGSVTYEKTSEAVGQAVPQKAAQTGAGEKVSATAEKMALAKKALEDDWRRNNLLPSHGNMISPPPMMKEFTTGEIAAKADEMFGKKTPAKSSTLTGEASKLRAGAGKGKVAHRLRMSDGSYREYDAAGNRIR